MKILILSANTGEGHNSCGKALMQAMRERGMEVEMKDTLSISKPNSKSHNSQIVSKAYVKSTRGFNIFSKVYALAQWVSRHLNKHRHSPIYWANKLYWRRLWHYIEDNHFDAVVSVHLFSAEKLTAVKREGKLNVPTYFVMTDYTLHAFLNDTELDYYIIPHKDLIPLYVSEGFRKESLMPFGIPVDVARFATRMDRLEARRQVAGTFGFAMTEKDESPEESKWYLMMSGSMGFGNMSVLLKEFLAHMRPDSRVICVCGRNRNNLKVIQRDFGDNPRVCPVGFTDRIALLMDACDVVLTKPGGITTTEAFVKNIPLVHTAPIPGIESENAAFCHERNMSFYSPDLKEQAAAAIRLANDPQYREAMLASQRANSRRYACEQIISLIEQNQTARHPANK